MNQPTGDDGSSSGVKLCECGCGQPTTIASYNNKRRGWIKGQPIRFIWGHGRRKPPSSDPKRGGSRPRLFAEVGLRFGRGVVIDPEVRIPDKSFVNGVRGARLRCDCGAQYVAGLSPLFGGRVQSCGCLVRDARRTGRPVTDRAGQRFGMLIVIKLAGTANGHAQWLCRCDCGNEVTVPAWGLSKTGNCGCQRTEFGGHSAPKGTRTPGEAARLHVLRQYQQNAKRRGFTWELTDEDFDRLTASDCFYCGIPPCRVFTTGKYEGAAFTYNGIDRIDSSRNYSLGNVVPCCNQCNLSKRAMPFDDFIAWIARLASHNFFRPELLPSTVLKAAQKPALRVVKDGDVA